VGEAAQIEEAERDQEDGNQDDRRHTRTEKRRQDA
jgi:hypothetical protein